MIALHVLDSTSDADALDMLALLIERSTGLTHHVLVLGHRRTAERACAAGIPAHAIRYGRSMGWADPTGWRALRQAIADLAPTHLHAWGLAAVVAATVQYSFAGPRLATLATPPTVAQLRLLRLCALRVPWVFVAPSSSTTQMLQRAGLDPTGPRHDDRASRVLRIRPGIVMKNATGANKTALRQELGLDAGDGPVLLLGGENVPAARHDHGLWAAAILQQVFPNIRVLTRSEPHAFAHRIAATRDFALRLPRPDMTVFVRPDLPWPTLVQAADIFLMTPDHPIATGSLLWAMAASVPVIGTAIECVSELIEHKHSGLLATVPASISGHVPIGKRGLPRALASRLEEFMSDATLRWPLTDNARTEVFAHFKPLHMLTSYAAVYVQTLADPAVRGGLELPKPEVTAADRFAGLLTMDR